MFDSRRVFTTTDHNTMCNKLCTHSSLVVVSGWIWAKQSGEAEPHCRCCTISNSSARCHQRETLRRIMLTSGLSSWKMKITTQRSWWFHGFFNCSWAILINSELGGIWRSQLYSYTVYYRLCNRLHIQQRLKWKARLFSSEKQFLHKFCVELFEHWL